MSERRDRPVYLCPGCGHLPRFTFGPEQAWCGNDIDCRVIVFNPSLRYTEEDLATMHMVDLSGLEPREPGEPLDPRSPWTRRANPEEEHHMPDPRRTTFRRPTTFTAIDPTWYEVIHIDPSDRTVYREPICGYFTMATWSQIGGSQPELLQRPAAGIDIEFAILAQDLGMPVPIGTGSDIWQVSPAGYPDPTPQEIEEHLAGQS